MSSQYPNSARKHGTVNSGKKCHSSLPAVGASSGRIRRRNTDRKKLHMSVWTPRERASTAGRAVLKVSEGWSGPKPLAAH